MWFLLVRDKSRDQGSLLFSKFEFSIKVRILCIYEGKTVFLPNVVSNTAKH